MTDRQNVNIQMTDHQNVDIQRGDKKWNKDIYFFLKSYHPMNTQAGFDLTTNNSAGRDNKPLVTIRLNNLASLTIATLSGWVSPLN
jgi:hypothetical protein